MMSEDTNTRLTRLEAGQADIKAALGEIKGMLAMLAPTIQGLDARMRSMETSIGRLDGRIEEQSKMLQLALGGRMSRPKSAA
jgi:uncharacterized coiled-coil protein SlyX